ncbi:MAG: hypothetical protein A3K67_03895 [Euryarchaeota archaeon RBG_16_62_10]|nr:MAG: hypothetical protein A3K67_03895 [Euryarchaeota archaeon RBG_16_62_10]
MILINLKKKLLVTAVVGGVLVLSAVLIASLGGNDKPSITTNPPAENEPPASNTAPDTDSDLPDAPEAPDEDDDLEVPDQPDDGSDDDESGDDASDGKKTGLERAYEVHVRNLERMQDKMAAKGKTMDAANLPPGLVHSTLKLGAKLGMTDTLSLEDTKGEGKGNNGQHKGQT